MTVSDHYQRVVTATTSEAQEDAPGLADRRSACHFRIEKVCEDSPS